MKTRIFVLLVSLLCLAQIKVKANLSKDWISYFGQGNTKIYGIEYDSLSGHIYIVGTTSEQDLGTSGTHQVYLDHSSNDPTEHLDIFLAKFSTNGQLVWFTYYGGSKRETNPGITLDKLGNIYISGYTNSTSGIASTGAHKTGILEGADFIAKFNAQGQRLWATYYAERNSFLPFGPMPAVDENNNVYLMGLTSQTTDIATPGTYQPQFNTNANYTNNKNVYLVKFNPSGQRTWGTYFGGGREIWNKDIHIDPQNNIYITGLTGSQVDIASPGSMVNMIDSGTETAFLAKFSANGQRIWSTYVHRKVSTITSIAADAAENVYLFGLTTLDSGIVTPGAWQTAPASPNGDFFLMKLNSAGQKVWSTYYGGEGDELSVFTINGMADFNLSKNRIRLGKQANPGIYVCGFSESLTGIPKGCTLPVNPPSDGVLAKFENNGQLLWGTKYEACIADFALGKADSLYFVTNTPKNNLATNTAHQPAKPSQAEAGLLGKLVEKFVCPSSFTAHFNRVYDSLKAQAGYLNYQWFRNDTLLQDGPQHYYLLQGYYQGVYKLKVQDSCICTFNSDTLWVAHPSTLKNMTQNKIEFNITPNPASNELNIQLHNPGKEVFLFRIYNILGRKVFEHTSKLDPGNKKVIDLSNYAPGLYILSVESREGKANVKFIRQ